MALPRPRFCAAHACHRRVMADSTPSLALAPILSMMPAALRAFWGFLAPAFRPEAPVRSLRRSLRFRAPVAELVDAPDSKSGGFTSVLVRVRPGAPEAVHSVVGEQRQQGQSGAATLIGREGEDARGTTLAEGHR